MKAPLPRGPAARWASGRSLKRRTPSVQTLAACQARSCRAVHTPWFAPVPGLRLLPGSAGLAARVAAVVGSWWFIGTQSLILLGRAWLNLTAWIQYWDPYPFVLMNLFLSLQAACTAPMLTMSQNRLAARDRLEAHNDYEINRKAEEE